MVMTRRNRTTVSCVGRVYVGRRPHRQRIKEDACDIVFVCSECTNGILIQIQYGLYIWYGDVCQGRERIPIGSGGGGG